MAHDFQYCYPNSNVLINKKNITDADELSKFERDISYLSSAKIRKEPVKGQLDYKHLKAIHKELFQDVYEWAGKPRTVNISKSNMFCNAMFLDNYAQDIFSKLQKDNFLLEMNRDRAIKKLAQYMGDINALHPFREGNGRTQRHFIYYLAKTTGINLNLGVVEKQEMIHASIKSFDCDYTELESIFNRISSPIPHEEQRAFISSISKGILKTYDRLNKNGELPDRMKEFDKADEVPSERAVSSTDKKLSLEEWKSCVTDARTQLENTTEKGSKSTERESR